MEQVAQDGKKRKINYYNLDMIISVECRVSSLKATKFRQWANSILKEYINSGYIINQDNLTQQRLSSIKEKIDLKSVKTDNKINEILNIIENKDIKPKQGIFYDGQIFDAYSFVSDLIKGAKSSILLIDNYIDDSVLTLLSKNQNINLIIYTNSISKQLKLDIEKYNSQYNKDMISKDDFFQKSFYQADKQLKANDIFDSITICDPE